MVDIEDTPQQQEINAPPASVQADEWHKQEASTVLTLLKTDSEAGLGENEAAARLEQYGPNELIDKGVKSPLVILWEQLTDPMVVVLIAAAVVSAFLGETKSVIAIGAIVTLNAMLGVSQEYRAEKAMAALKKMAAPAVRARRGGKVTDIAPSTLVPGDIIMLEAGSIIPADARLVEAANLKVQEASLTGESVAVEKIDRRLHGEDIALGDRHNMVFMGTSVTYGRGTAVITDTGMKTQLGRIATLIQDVETEKTPLQRRMAQLGQALFFIAIGIVAAATLLGIVQQGMDHLDTVFLGAVAIAVAVVPEGLPAVVTISLALGAQRMLRREALIRKLPAVETLGSVTVIASDKTGTLTENKMTVKVIDVAGETHDVTDIVQRSKRVVGTVRGGINAERPTASEAVLLAGSVLCNDAIMEKNDGGADTFDAVGDPTEGALLVAAAHFDLWKADLEAAFPRVGEVPFTSERKRMSTVHRIEAENARDAIPEVVRDLGAVLGTPYIAFTKGAVDGLLDICDFVWEDGRVQPMTDAVRERIITQNDSLARNGLRVLGAALKPLESLPETVDGDSIEQGLIFSGMNGMIDPPRAEVKQAVADCHTAGIRPVMITGDHPLTALTIAKELNIAQNEDILTGADLNRMSDGELHAAVKRVSVYARVSPEHKLNIVQALQNNGEIVAMTGDGVNDAPALKRADIGVAMGITGTPVSKEASEMVILDDNFATIVSAAEEGRTIYDNVRKFVKYILASNTGEVSVLFLTQLLGMPLPLNTIQILWMNLVTDGLPALALGVEKGERDSMQRPPHDPNEGIFARGLGGYLLRIGALIAAVTMAVVLLIPQPEEGVSVSVWGTMVFTTLTLSQMGHALAIRSEHESVFKIGILSNPAMLGAIGLTITLQLALIYVPFLQDFFGTVALSAGELALCFALSIITFAGVEFDKWFFHRRNAAA